MRFPGTILTLLLVLLCANGLALTAPGSAVISRVHPDAASGGRLTVETVYVYVLTPRFNHYSSRGDVTAQLNGSGDTAWTASYQADGLRTTEKGSSKDRQKANTKEEDPTGLLNEGFRYRDLETGVFLSRDPLGFVDGPNVYTYVRQNPWTLFDPEGLKFPRNKEEAGKHLDSLVEVSRKSFEFLRRAIGEPEWNAKALVRQADAYHAAGNYIMAELEVYNAYADAAGNLGEVTAADFSRMVTENGWTRPGSFKIDAQEAARTVFSAREKGSKSSIYTLLSVAEAGINDISATWFSVATAPGWTAAEALASAFEEEGLPALPPMTINGAIRSVVSNAANRTIATSGGSGSFALQPESILSKHIRGIHASLPESGATAVFRKGDVSMGQLRTLTSVTGDEYSMFTLGSQRFVIRGRGSVVDVSPSVHADLLAGKYGRFSGHTHPPGHSLNPGPGDQPFLRSMGQKQSGIWGDGGAAPFDRGFPWNIGD